MRVISGIYKGKNLLGFDINGTRPTMDRVKESMFASIQNNIKDAVVLDLFAGSGSLGIEALSNGASICYFVDNNKIAIDTINKNLSNVDNGIVLNMDFKDALKYFSDNKIKFNLILLDPPYYKNLLNDAIKLIEEYDLLNGILVCEVEGYDVVTNYKLLKEKKYGPKEVKIYKKWKKLKIFHFFLISCRKSESFVVYS